MSRPHLAKLSQAIEASEGGVEAIFDRIANGDTIKSIMEPFGYSRGMFYSWLKAGGPERQCQFEEARKIAAHGLIEDADELLEKEKPVTSGEAQHLRMRIEQMRWKASRFNREEYGEDREKLNVELNIGQLHLDALRAGGTRPLPVASEVPLLESGE